MRVILFGVAWGSIVVGFVHASFALPGSRRETEAIILVLCGLLAGACGFLLSRLQTKKCHGCQERIPVAAERCKYCGTQVVREESRSLEA